MSFRRSFFPRRHVVETEASRPIASARSIRPIPNDPDARNRFVYSLENGRPPRAMRTYTYRIYITIYIRRIIDIHVRLSRRNNNQDVYRTILIRS